jgi:outer membrane protein assembly factor BamB
MRVEFKKTILHFYEEKNILVCSDKSHEGRKLWVKKLPDVRCVSSMKEDVERYYVACEYTDTDGIFIALNKETGNTVWYIPGRSLLQIIYKNYPYLIFIDEEEKFHLIKADPKDGRKIWHHPLDNDLNEYSFYRDKITLRYRSGKRDVLAAEDGRML